MKKKPAPPKFTISVLALNGLEMTRSCIEAVLAHSKNAEILLTDNASNDGTAGYFKTLARSHKFVHVITNEVNEGFAEPNNHALSLAKGTYFVTLNNDAVVPPGWLEMLEHEMTSHPNSGLAGASGTCCGFRRGATEFLGAPMPDLDYIEGSCLMGRTETLREVGLFSPFLKMAYGEDCDLSFRMRSLGYTLHLAPFKIEHRRAASASQVPRLREYQARNHAYLLKRWGQYLKWRRLDLPFVVRRTGAWGDCVLATALIRAIKEQNPQSEIFVETACADVFRNNPHVAGVARSWQQHYAYATIINLDMSYENKPMTNYQDAYEQEAGIVVKDRKPEVFITGVETDITSWVKEEDFMVIHMGPTWPSRMWTDERWKEVIGVLRRDGHKVVLVGGESATAMECDMDYRGKTSVRALMALTSNASQFIGIDSFPLHIAIACGVPSVGLFGISYSHIVIPKGTNCIGVDSDPTHPLSGARSKVTGPVAEIKCLPERSPMLTISVERVLEAVGSKEGLLKCEEKAAMRLALMRTPISASKKIQRLG